MRPLELIRLIIIVTLLAAAPVIGAIAAYAQSLAPVSVGPLKDPYLGGPAPVAGQNVVASDGQRVGAVTDVTSSAAGYVRELRFKTGGFLGFGARTVAVPAGRFAVSGQDVYINLSSRDVAALPEADAGQSR
jgi:hypothetical protein